MDLRCQKQPPATVITRAVPNQPGTSRRSAAMAGAVAPCTLIGGRSPAGMKTRAAAFTHSTVSNLRGEFRRVRACGTAL
eukprot:scaffold104943_cov31-Tisochrysis_lutea.AAC.2